MDLFTNLLVLGFIAAALWWACQPRYVFLVRLVGGEPRVARGKVTAAFLQMVREVCAPAGVRHGWVGGVTRGRRIALHFSRSIPRSCQQRLRNQHVLNG
jgi:hypothetical protein